MTSLAELWNLYPPERRAAIHWFFDTENCEFIDVSFPETIECVFFTCIDRGVADWKRFVTYLRIWFPSLRTLLIRQKYSYVQDEHFVDFMRLDSWLEHIWVDNIDTNKIEYDIIQPTRTRVFRQSDEEDWDDTVCIDFRWCRCDDYGRSECTCDPAEFDFIHILRRQLEIAH